MNNLTGVVVGALIGVPVYFLAAFLLKRRQRKLVDALQEFFGAPPDQLPITSRTFATVDLPNLQLAFDRYAEHTGAQMSVIGYSGSAMTAFHGGFSNLIGGGSLFETVRVSAPNYRETDIDVDTQLRCLEQGIHLIRAGDKRFAAHVWSSQRRPNEIQVEVISGSVEDAGTLLETLRSLAASRNVYRGKVISLECGSEMPGERGHAGVRFHAVTQVEAEDLILPEATFKTLERNTVGFFRNAEALRRSGRSVRRGLLLHGKPGTGKTYSARWLSQAIPGVTTILVSGEQLAMVKTCCRMARTLAPALLVLEDVDLIASERNESRHPIYQFTLHTLLNEMDGISSDAEVLFVLTTNRPDVIEPAIAARPGRVDQAIEFPLPDAHCRRRLIQLYSRGLVLALEDPERIIGKTEGASPAFIQELLRKGALVAAEEGSTTDGVLRVTDAHLEAALSELMFAGGELTRQFLGFPATESQPSEGELAAISSVSIIQVG